MATAGVATWLIWVSLTVLPSRDPERLTFWQGLAVAFFLYSAITVLYLLATPMRRSLILVLTVASVAAFVFGAYAVLDMVVRSSDFEGYIVLIGAVLAGHGALVLFDLVASRRETLLGSQPRG